MLTAVRSRPLRAPLGRSVQLHPGGRRRRCINATLRRGGSIRRWSRPTGSGASSTWTDCGCAAGLPMSLGGAAVAIAPWRRESWTPTWVLPTWVLQVG